MAQPYIQPSFASGEWAPKLRSRVDIAKYRHGASLLRNFYVDYAGGGASTRQGSKFINQAFKSAKPVRVVGFQPTSTLSYVLEFGDGYIRFFSNGAPILETAVTGGTAASGNTFTIANTYSVGDWVFAQNWGGLTNVNGRYFIVLTAAAGNITVTDLFGNVVTFTGTYTSGGQLQRVFTLTSPFAASDLFPNPVTGNPGLKFTQDVTSLIITHPSYLAQILTINSPTNWTITAINYGATIGTPTGLTVTTTLTVAANNWNYSYLVTAVDINGQESTPTTPVTITGFKSINDTTAPGTNNISWTAVTGAVSYNVYKATPTFNTVMALGVPYGFIGNVTGISMQDPTPGITPDFAQTPPVPENPFMGAGVQSYTVTAAGTYTTVPGVTVASPPAGGAQATAQAQLGIISSTLNAPGAGFTANQIYNIEKNGIIYGTLKVLTLSGSGIATYQIIYAGSITSGTVPSNPLNVDNNVLNGSINATWGVVAVNPIQDGTGYISPPAVTFSAGAAAATAVLGQASAGNPGVSAFIQARLALLAQPKAIQGFNLSQPASFFNFNTSNPIEATDAISGSIISEELNDIRSAVQVPTGLLMFTGRAAWLLNGGGGISTQNPITPSNVTAQAQAFNGANDLPPKRVNFDLLYATNKGNYVRDLTYNLYAQIFTGTDISVLSNHLFFNHFLTDWCWAEEPFKTLWAIRDDGQMLSLGYVKEQDMIGWAHHDTNGQFTSTCSVFETIGPNTVDAVYFVVQRFINGQFVQYIERMADRYFTYGFEDSWSVDSALQTVPAVSPTTNLFVTGNASAVGNSVTLTDTASAPFTSTMATNNWVVRLGGGIYTITAFTSSSIVTATVTRVPTLLNQYTNVPFPGSYAIWQPVSTVTNLTNLVGQNVVGVADGAAIGPLTVSAAGSVTLPNTATKVTLGLSYTPQLQTLPLDLGEPTVQGKRKKIVAVNCRVSDTLGLQIGTSFPNVVTMKDFTLGNIGTQSNALVTDLVIGDGRTIIDQAWQEAGNYCVQQNLPYPATVLAVMPEVVVGDTAK